MSPYFQGESRSKLEKVLKSMIQSKVNQIKVIELGNEKTILNNFGKRWIYKWFGIVDLEEKWFQQIWTEEELGIISAINSEIDKIEEKERVEIIASKDLVQLVSRFQVSQKKVV